jgi:hypothetical protein
MRKLMAALAMGMAAAGGSMASAEEPLTVTLHVTDYANLSRQDLATAEAYAAAIYRAAGIETVWTDAPWRPGEARSPHLRVAILSRDMAQKKCKGSGLGETAMGVAVDGEGVNEGRVAYVFSDRIGRAAVLNFAKFDHGLGHVMAHEVGHLLLGAHSHSGTGLMSGDWHPRDPHVQTLTAEQAGLIRRHATTMHTM